MHVRYETGISSQAERQYEYPYHLNELQAISDQATIQIYAAGEEEGRIFPFGRRVNANTCSRSRE